MKNRTNNKASSLNINKLLALILLTISTTCQSHAAEDSCQSQNERIASLENQIAALTETLNEINQGNTKSHNKETTQSPRNDQEDKKLATFENEIKKLEELKKKPLLHHQEINDQAVHLLYLAARAGRADIVSKMIKEEGVNVNEKIGRASCRERV